MCAARSSGSAKRASSRRSRRPRVEENRSSTAASLFPLGPQADAGGPQGGDASFREAVVGKIEALQARQVGTGGEEAGPGSGGEARGQGHGPPPAPGARAGNHLSAGAAPDRDRGARGS